MDSPCSCGHFEMRLTFVVVVVFVVVGWWWWWWYWYWWWERWMFLAELSAWVSEWNILVPGETSLDLVDENTNIDKQAQILISKQINNENYLIYQYINTHKNQRLRFKGSGGAVHKICQDLRGERVKICRKMAQWGVAGKGRVATSKRMNFMKSPKRPLTPPLICGNSCCIFFIISCSKSPVFYWKRPPLLLEFVRNFIHFGVATCP